jgi:Mn2+/Fe2+ NRAMP family transporter
MIMFIAQDRGSMGTFTNGRLARTLGWFATGLMTAAATLFLFLSYGPV